MDSKPQTTTSSTDTKKAKIQMYNKIYYNLNKERLSVSAKTRYKTDEAFRKKKIAKAKESYRKRKLAKL